MKIRVIEDYCEQLYTNKTKPRWNGYIPKDIKTTKSNLERNRKSEKLIASMEIK